VFRDVTTIETGCIDSDDTVGRKECDRKVDQDASYGHIELIKRLTQRRREREFRQIDRAPNAGHLDRLVEKRPVRRILLHLETEQDNMLRECIAVFREFRGVSRDCSACQMNHFLSKTAYLRLREGIHLVEVQDKSVTL